MSALAMTSLVGLGLAPLGATEPPSDLVHVQADDAGFGRRAAAEAGRIAATFLTHLRPSLLEDRAREADPPALCEVRLFDRLADFSARADADGSAAGGGYSRRGCLVGWRHGATDEQVMRMVRHEVTHHLVAWAVGDGPFTGYGSAGVPRALDEGLAELFETGWPERPNLEHAPLLADMLRQGALPALREILAGGAWVGLERDREYAVGYAIASFCMEHEARVEILRRALARAREQGEETMANQLVDDLARMAGGEEALERAWRRSVRRLAAWERGIEATLPAARPEGPAAEKARDLVEALGAPDYTLRSDATQTLQSMGAQALPALHEGMRSSEPEVRVRARTLARETLGAGRGNWWSKSRTTRRKR